MVVEVIFPYTWSKTYFYTADAVNIGEIVMCEFGPRVLSGLIVRIVSVNPLDASNDRALKHAVKAETHIAFSSKHIDFIMQLSAYYFVNPGTVFKLIYRTTNKRAISAVLKHAHFTLHPLTADQAEALAYIQKHDITLLTGATGSGKTNVFLHAIPAVGQVLILMPEILLTSNLGSDIIWHSKVSKSLKDRIYNHAIQGRDIIVIGARSAIFIPFTNLKLIVIDEEHDQSFKQSTGFRYNVLTCAIILSKIHNCKLILVSATPCLESVHKFPTIALTREQKHGLAQVQIIDMRNEKEMLAGKTLDLIRNSKKTLVFLNKKGFAHVAWCTICRKRQVCIRCSVGLVYYAAAKKLLCHLCGYCIKASCCDHELYFKNYGIERVQHILAQHFPDKTISIATGEQKQYDVLADIIIGTQVMAQGHDISDLDLVVVVDIDTMLLHPSYNAFEKTLALIKQVRGRAGRGDIKGTCILQTSFPTCPIFTCIDMDFMTWCKTELVNRKALDWPPFGHICALTLESKDLSKLKVQIDVLKQAIQQLTSDILGPVPVRKKKYVYGYNLFVKYQSRSALAPIVAIAQQHKAIIDTEYEPS